MQPVHSQFDANSPRYRCCCSSCHATNGARIIGYVEAVGLILNAIQAIANYARGAAPVSQLGGAIASLIISGIVIGCLLYGLYTQRAGFLLPHLIVMVIGMVLLLIAAIALIVIAAVGGEVLRAYAGANNVGVHWDDTTKSVLVIVLIITGVACFLSIIFQIWFFTVILAAYRYLRERVDFQVHYAASKGMEHGQALGLYPSVPQQQPQNPYTPVQHAYPAYPTVPPADHKAQY